MANERRKGWFFEWAEPQPTPADQGQSWWLRAYWVDRFHRQARGHRWNLDSIVVRKRSEGSTSWRAKSLRAVWYTVAWIPRVDVEKAIRGQIGCHLLTDGFRHRPSNISTIGPEKAQAMLVALDQWLEAR
jgi:hypothetical protein